MDNNKTGFDEATLETIRRFIMQRNRLLYETQQAGKMVIAKDQEVPLRNQEPEKKEDHSKTERKAELLKRMEHISQGPRFLLYQKYNENGMYERSSESPSEQNYNMIDGNHNNMVVEREFTSGQVDQKQGEKKTVSKNHPRKGPIHPYERVSIILRLRRKQNEIAKKYGKPEPYQNMEQELTLGSKR